MARMHPPHQSYDLPREVAEAHVRELAEGLPAEAVCFTQVHLIDQHGNHREIDLLVAWPGVGIAVVEVKGGRVSAPDGQWRSRDGKGVSHEIADPVRQAEKGMWALKHYVTSRPEWRDVWPAAVVPVAVLPFSSLRSSFRTPGALSEQYLDRSAVTDEDTFAERLRAAVVALRPGVYEPLSQLQLQMLVELLEVSLPSQADMLGLLDEHETVVNLLTRQQYRTLRDIRLNDRIIVNGGPGTGKTWLALEHARQESARGARVALVCYSRGLAEHLRRVTSAWPEQHRPAYAGTFHYLAQQWSGAEPRNDSAYYAELPSLLAAATESADPARAYDLLVVDEAQDFADDWWPALLGTLADPDGPVVVFQDDAQRIFAGRGSLPFSGTEVSLEENLRNTQEIAATFEPLGTSMTARGPEGPPVRFVRATDASAVAVADRVVEALVREGLPADSIAVLTTYRRHPRHTELLHEQGTPAYWDTYRSGDVFYSTVQSFKGLERAVVVLTVNGFNFDDVEREILHVGMSRARSLLIVVADAATIAGVDHGSELIDHLTPHEWSP